MIKMISVNAHQKQNANTAKTPPSLKWTRVQRDNVLYIVI